MSEAPPDPKPISTLSKAKLREECERLNLPTDGRKSVLVERLCWAVRVTMISRRVVSLNEELEGFRASEALTKKLDGSEAALRVSLGALVGMYGPDKVEEHCAWSVADMRYVAGFDGKGD